MSCVIEVGDHIAEVLPDEMRKKKPIVQFRSPWHERLPVGFIPEFGDKSAQEELLDEAHAFMRRHLKGAQLKHTLAPGPSAWRIEFVDAKLGPVHVASNINQDITENPIHQPGRDGAFLGNLVECDLQFVERIVACLIHARALASGPYEETREQVGKRRMILPVIDQTPKQVGPAQERAIRGCRTSHDEVIAATGAAVAPIEHKLLGSRAASDALRRRHPL